MRSVPDIVLDGLRADGTLPLRPGRITIGVAPHNDMRVTGIRLYGRENCMLEVAADGACQVIDGGHRRRVRVNGVEVDSRRLAHGDIIEPAAVDEADGPPIAFVFETAAAM